MTNPLFQPLDLLPGVTLRNRLVMAPMTTWSANDDFTVSHDEDRYYRRRVSGVGMVVTGCSRVSANGIGFPGEFAAHDDAYLPSLRRLADATRSGGACAILQIYHAGPKAVPALVPEGDIVGASAGSPGESTFCEGQIAARELSNDEILAIVSDFGSATHRAIAAGFDGVELHGAHGFLIHNFLSPRSNHRTDAWGGSLDGRLRFPLAVVAEVKRVIAEEAKRPFALGYRISVEEPGDGGLRIEDSLALVNRLVEAGISYVHASQGDLLHDRPVGSDTGPTVVEILLETLSGSLPLLAAGRIRTPDQAVAARALGLPFVAIGQGLIMNPDWVQAAERGLDDAVATELDLARAGELAIPEKLKTVIEATSGWFAIQKAPETVA